MNLCYTVAQSIPRHYINIFQFFTMYRLGCRKLGFDCDFIVRKSDRNSLVNNFCKHLLTNHEKYYPTSEILGFIKDQNKNQFEDNKFNPKTKVENDDSSRMRKWFLGRKNFP